jgi:flagellar hook assembly protein FlgD
VSFTGTATDSDGSIALYEWDFDGDGVFDWSSPTTGDTSYTYDRSGFFNAAFRATDNDGLTAGASIMISVSGPPIALPGAFPTEGDVPLTVTFFSDGKDPDGSLVEFAWDLDDNGSYEWKDMVAGSVTHTYHTAGVHNAVLKVTDSDGLIGTAPITINATDPNPQGYPLANAIAHPVNGGAPLDVALVGNADDANGSLVKYEWDFDGDGTYDWEEFEKAIATIGLLIDVNSYSTPEFVDIDNDGDIDLFIGETNGRIYFYRNDGNSKAPRWAAMGLVTDADATTIDVGNHSIPALTDIDNDGDLDLFTGQNEGRIHFYRNDGNSESPVWTPLGLLTDAGSNTIDVGSWSTPVFADIDDDEDMDLFVGESYGRISFYRNDGNRNAPVWTPMGFISDADSITIDIGSYSEATFTDIDNDGDLDMFGGYSQGRIYFYRNDGSAGAPLWASQGLVTDSNDNTIDAGSYSSPVFKDIDNDGDGDMFLGRSSGEIVFYRNTGDASAPIWNLVTKKYNYIEVSNYATPALADTDNDGDADLYVGDYQDGVLHFWRNDGNAGSPAWRTPGLLVTADNGEPIDIGNFNSPAFADLDNDGDFDLFIGEHSGRIHFYRNDGDSGTPVWTAQGFLMYPDSSLIDIGSNSHPAFVDIDDDGDFDLFVGEYYGKIQFIRNEGNSNVPLWAYVGLIENSEGNPISVPYRSRPAFADMDHDGDHDLLIGCNNGKAYYYRNDGDAQTPIWNRASSNFDDLDLNGSSAPYFVDLDNDRDFDVIIGNGVGDIYLYRTSGQIFHLYETPGTYEATFRVTDNQDLSSEDTVTIRVYETGSPTALALAEPVTGDIPLTVSFYGKGTDPDGTITLYEWDFDGDGTYDWNSTTTGNTSHSYAYAGTFSATLRVTDDSGKTATDAVIIEPRLSITTSRTDAFNPFVGEQGTITLTIGDAAVITIWIIDADGNVVRTLVFDESRAAGTYEDIWDGRNDAGQLVPDGAYFFLIEYTVSNGTYIYDLRTAALYEQNYSGITHPSIFAPYEDDFYQVTYELPKPAYVRMHTWTWDYGYGPMGLVKTLLVKELIGAGTHTEIWDGTDDKGRPAPTDKLYALGQIFWEVPDNAIIIKGGRPEITDVSADPNYFSPVYNPYGSTPTPTTIVRYHLSESSDVACTVVNAQGLVVKMISKQNLPAGSNAIVWDGRDDDGNMVSAGRYTISLLATDGKGNQSKPRSAFLVVYY